ncbi:hypothetical protein CC86DRAFT_347700 [Ophiobolus disseminans]|uniref:Uncharacterized protein n=1 Tax=Ophiobolus disseminans TaxID=1469910 RepID=A0A6A7A565_9PLEO|nr:hypothetical protein CC86DRAFT_347700 [Ophiobolus disseminans]
MVDTPGSNRSGRPVADESNETRSEGENNDIVHVQTPRPSKICNVSITPKPSTTVSTATPSSTGGMDDINLTSPSTAVSVPDVLTKKPKRKRDDPPVSDRTLFSTLRRLATKPEASKGSVSNPIDLDEYSPRRAPIALPEVQHHGPEPHKFRKRQKKVYKHEHGQDAPRTALAPKSTNGITFTGHKIEDMYRMINAKITAAGCAPPVTYTAPPPGPHAAPPPAPYQAPPPVHKTSHNYDFTTPFEAQYPLSAKYLGPPPVHHHSTYTHYHTQMSVSLAGDSEPMLRKKALQHVRQSTRPQHRRKALSNDVDETSASDSDETVLAGQHVHKKRKLAVYQDRHDYVAPLVAQTALVAALLQIYPSSRDRRGLREDIGLLVAAQKRGVDEWVGYEDEEEKRLRLDKGMEVERVGIVVYGRLEIEDARKMDGEVRGLLASGAGLWGDGGVAEGVEGVGGGVDGCEEGACARDDEAREKGVCGWDMVR